MAWVLHHWYTVMMHIQKNDPSHSFRMTVTIAVVLSSMLVTFASLVGRETINLKGSLQEKEFGKVTALAVLLPSVDSLPVENVYILPRRNDDTRAAFYFKSGQEWFFATAVRDNENGWHLAGGIQPLRSDDIQNITDGDTMNVDPQSAQASERQ